jgi:heparan-alpha-glucosaminide N-acetyltransferase
VHLVQRIAIAYVVVAVCEIWLRGGAAAEVQSGCYSFIRRYRHQLWACYNFNRQSKLWNIIFVALHHRSALFIILQRFVGLVLTVTYTGLLYDMYVPDWEYDVTSEGSTLTHFLVLNYINYNIINQLHTMIFLYLAP